jgi:hypothetical protein
MNFLKRNSRNAEFKQACLKTYRLIVMIQVKIKFQNQNIQAKIVFLGYMWDKLLNKLLKRATKRKD